MNTSPISHASVMPIRISEAEQDAPHASTSSSIGPGLTLSVGRHASPPPEKYQFHASLRRDSAASGIDEAQAVSLPLADNHVSEFGQSVRELLQYQLDLINTAGLALTTRNRAEGDEPDGARRTGTGGYQRLGSEPNLPELVKLTQEIFDAMTHLEQDRNATATELRTAGRLRNKLVSLIAGEYRRNGVSYCQAKRLAVGDYHDARITFLNNKSWKTLRHPLSHKAHTYVSTQRPAAEMKLSERNIFEKPYDGKGTCSADTVSVDHAANLWQSSLSVKEANGQEKVLFQGIHHGVLSPYGAYSHAIDHRFASKVDHVFAS